MPFPVGFNYDEAAVMVKEHFEPTFYRTFVRNNVFMQLIQPQTDEYIQKDITWKAHYASNPAAGSYAEDGDIGTNRTDLAERFETARLRWAQNGVPIKVSGLAKAITQSPNAIIDALGENTEQALKQLQHNMNLQLLSDGAGNLNGVNPALKPGGTDITGIQAGLDDGGDVPVYAGLDRSVMTWWQAFVLRNPITPGNPRPLTEELMHQVTNELRQVRQGKVTHILCSPNVWTQFGLLLGQDRRFNFSPNQNRQPNEYIGGFQALMFNDIPVVSVPLYEEGRMDFIDIDLIRYRLLLNFTIEPRDSGNRDASTMHAKSYSQLQVLNPFMLGSLRDLLV
jgi:hypothetical protein